MPPRLKLQLDLRDSIDADGGFGGDADCDQVDPGVAPSIEVLPTGTLKLFRTLHAYEFTAAGMVRRREGGAAADESIGAGYYGSYTGTWQDGPSGPAALRTDEPRDGQGKGEGEWGDASGGGAPRPPGALDPGARGPRSLAHPAPAPGPLAGAAMRSMRAAGTREGARDEGACGGDGPSGLDRQGSGRGQGAADAWPPAPLSRHSSSSSLATHSRQASLSSLTSGSHQRPGSRSGLGGVAAGGGAPASAATAPPLARPSAAAPAPPPPAAPDAPLLAAAARQRSRSFAVNERDVRLVKELGAGACGTVFLAFLKSSRSFVAVKMISVLERDKRRQLLNDLRALCSAPPLPGLARLIGAYHAADRGQIALVLEYADGGSLQGLTHARAARWERERAEDRKEAARWERERGEDRRESARADRLETRDSGRAASTRAPSTRASSPTASRASSSRSGSPTRSAAGISAGSGWWGPGSLPRHDSPERRRPPPPPAGTGRAAGAPRRLTSKGLPESFLASVARRVLGALRYLHGRRAVHRDVKPANVLLTSDGEASLSDFGISAFVDGTIAACQTFLGTLSYMSPERVEGKSYAYPADIWALGLTILEASLGDYPYDASKGALQLMVQMIEDPCPLPPEGSGKRLPSPDLCDFVRLCMERDPLDRPSAEQLLRHPFLQQPPPTPREVRDIMRDVRSNEDALEEAAVLVTARWLDALEGPGAAAAPADPPPSAGVLGGSLSRAGSLTGPLGRVGSSGSLSRQGSFGGGAAAGAGPSQPRADALASYYDPEATLSHDYGSCRGRYTISERLEVFVGRLEAVVGPGFELRMDHADHQAMRMSAEPGMVVSQLQFSIWGRPGAGEGDGGRGGGASYGGRPPAPANLAAHPGPPQKLATLASSMCLRVVDPDDPVPGRGTAIMDQAIRWLRPPQRWVRVALEAPVAPGKASPGGGGVCKVQ